MPILRIAGEKVKYPPFEDNSDYFKFLIICDGEYHFYRSKTDFEEMISCLKASKRQFKAYRLTRHR